VGGGGYVKFENNKEKHKNKILMKYIYEKDFKGSGFKLGRLNEVLYNEVAQALISLLGFQT
jgi:hypothetical protein